MGDLITFRSNLDKMKNKMRFNFILCFCFFALSSCSQVPLDDSYELKFKEKLSLEIDEQVYCFSKAMFAFKDPNSGKEYLSYENNEKGQHEIVIFDLHSGQIDKRIQIEKDGPDAIFMFGHYPVDLNTFYVTSPGRHIIYKIDGSGKVLDSYDYALSTDEEFLTIASSMSIIYRPLIMRDSCLYFPQALLKSTMEPEDWSKTPMGAKLDMKNRTVEKTELRYPMMFSKRLHAMSQIETGCNLIFDGTNFIYHFAKRDNILVSRDNRSMEVYEVKSRYANAIKPSLNSPSGILELERETISQAMYWHLIYDPYRELYYRFVFFPCEFNEKDDVMKLTHTRQEFSIIILNKNFEVIGESKFPKNRYMPKMVFVGEKGLYISENNPSNENFNEDELIFSCFLPEHK